MRNIGKILKVFASANPSLHVVRDPELASASADASAVPLSHPNLRKVNTTPPPNFVWGREHASSRNNGSAVPVFINYYYGNYYFFYRLIITLALK